jgi:hypothetical protein
MQKDRERRQLVVYWSAAGRQNGNSGQLDIMAACREIKMEILVSTSPNWARGVSLAGTVCVFAARLRYTEPASDAD